MKIENRRQGTKKAFTLVEMLIAITLTALILFYLYAVLHQVQKSHRIYEKKLTQLQHKERLYQTLSQDIMLSIGTIHIKKESGFDRAYLVGRHSLYGFSQPWIYYYVSRKESALVRIESNKAIDFDNNLLADGMQSPYFYSDILARKCHSFRIELDQDRAKVWIDCNDTGMIAAIFPKGGE